MRQRHVLHTKLPSEKTYLANSDGTQYVKVSSSDSVLSTKTIMALSKRGLAPTDKKPGGDATIVFNKLCQALDYPSAKSPTAQLTIQAYGDPNTLPFQHAEAIAQSAGAEACTTPTATSRTVNGYALAGIGAALLLVGAFAAIRLCCPNCECIKCCRKSPTPTRPAASPLQPPAVMSRSESVFESKHLQSRDTPPHAISSGLTKPLLHEIVVISETGTKKHISIKR